MVQFNKLNLKIFILVNTIGATNFSASVEANLRILKHPSITLNTTLIHVKKEEDVYIKALTEDAYPATAIVWKIENNVLLETPPGDCSPDKDPASVCPSFGDTLAHTVVETDNNKNLDCFAKQIDSFNNIVYTQKTILIQVVDDSNDGEPIVWTAGKISGLVIGLILLLLLIIVILLLVVRIRRRRHIRKDVKQDLVNSSYDNTDIVINPADLERSKYGSNLVVKDAPEQANQENYGQQLNTWPNAFTKIKRFQGNLNNNIDRYCDPYESEEDEPLIYIWEGFGRPLSPAGSLSSLESEDSHIDDIDLSTPLNNLHIRVGQSPSKGANDDSSFSSDTTTLQNATWSNNEYEEEDSTTSELDSSSDFNSYNVSNQHIETETYV